MKTFTSPLDPAHPSENRAERNCGLVSSGYRPHIEAIGLRQSDAAAYALRLIGMMMQEAHTKGHSCGGETGNASGNWTDIGLNAPGERPGQEARELKP